MLNVNANVKLSCISMSLHYGHSTITCCIVCLPQDGKKPLDDLNERIEYWKLKEEALYHTLWRTRFGRGCGFVARQTMWWWMGLVWGLWLRTAHATCLSVLGYVHVGSTRTLSSRRWRRTDIALLRKYFLQSVPTWQNTDSNSIKIAQHNNCRYLWLKHK